MKQKNIKIDYNKVKDIIIAILLTVWIMIPLFKTIKYTSLFTAIYEYKFMEIISIVGIYLFAIEIYKSVKKCEDKKMLLKQLLPIIILILYLFWTLISCVFSENKVNAFYGTSNRKDGFITYLIYAGFFACSFLISSDKIRKYLLNLFVVIAVFNIVILNFTNNNELLEIFNYGEIKLGVFNNSNHYGYYLVLATISTCILFITQKNRILKILYVLAYIVLVYNLILNNTLGCYLAVVGTIIMFLLYCIYNKKYLVFSIISILIFIVMSCTVKSNGRVVVFNNFKGLNNDINTLMDKNKASIEKEKTGSGRFKLWKYGIVMILQKPILGYGAENLEQEYAKYNIVQDRPHNLLIQLATTSGLPGLVLYMSTIVLILIRGLKCLKKKDCDSIFLVTYFTTIAYLISAMFGNSMYYTSPYFFIFLGMVMNFEKRLDIK